MPVVVSSRLADPERYLESMELGAFDFICVPYYNTDIAALAMAMLHMSPPNFGRSRSSNMTEAT